ncbi:restriction endonuclease subunit S [Candidatus Gracilibacteria bacterium]|nr:restriction endonuclease subunit S [Candidatus Gracilibacteria bacterium]
MYPTKKLGEVCEIKKGKKVNYSEQGKYNYIDIGILRTNIIEQYTNDEGIFCNKNDILIAWDGSKSGTVGFGLEGVIGSTLAKITIDTKMFSSEFIGKFLQGNFDYLNKNTSGAAIPHLRKDILINLEIPLPPLSTQKLIVEKLDMIFAEIEKSKNLLEKNLQNVDEMNKSVLEKIFAKDKWERKKLGEVCENIQYGYTGKTIECGDVKYLRITDIQNNKINWEKVPFVDIPKQEISKYSLNEGDIVFARTGATVGKSCVILKDGIGNVFASYLIRIVPEEKIFNSNFLQYFFYSENYWKQIYEDVVGAAQPNFNGTKLKQISIPLPPLETQKNIVSYLDNIFAENQKLKNLYQAQIKNLDEMKQSFLKKAFAGELV